MRRNNFWVVVALAAILIATIPLYTSAVDRTEEEQNAAIDRLECEVFGESCPTPEPHTATPTSEPEPTATDVPATATTPSDPTLSGWHAPTTHDHGDAPPGWATAFSMATFGHGIVYGGDEFTGAMERDMKHEAYKGILIPLQAGGQAYLRYHAASNPMDRAAQYHSYEVYIRDTKGNVSFFQGHYDTGSPQLYPAGNRVPRSIGDPQRRPVILVVDQASYNAGIKCEQWYMFGRGGWSPEFALTICGSTTLYVAGENDTAHDQSTWVVSPDGTKGLERRAEVFWYPARVQGYTGWFCAEPDGDALPGDGTAAGCPDGSLPQYIAPTLAGDARVNFRVNRVQGEVQKTFSCPACVLPN